MLYVVGCTPAAPQAPARPPTPTAKPTTESKEPAVTGVCLSDELARKGSVAQAGDHGDGVAFCVSEGLTPEDARTCLRFDPTTGDWTEAIQSFSRDFVTPPRADEPASVETRSTAGTMTICSKPKRCTTIQRYPRVQDAYDEVWGSLPAVRLTDARVLVAHPKRKNPGELWLEVWNVDGKRTTSRKRVEPDGYAPLLVRLGPSHALMVHCAPYMAADRCAPRVIDTTALTMRDVDIQLAVSQSGVDEPLVQRSQSQWVVFDARGTAAVWLNEKGEVARRLDFDMRGPERPVIGRIENDRVVLLEHAPHAGTGFVVDLKSGVVTRLTAPSC